MGQQSIQKGHNADSKTSAQGAFVYSDVFKRTEKIVSALYLVTDTFQSDDILRNQIRSCGVRALSFLSGFVDNREERFAPSFVDKLPKYLVELLALLDVSHMAGLCSEMNYRLVSQEIEGVISMCANSRAHATDVHSDDMNFLAANLVSLRARSILPTRPTNGSNKGHRIGHSVNKNVRYSNSSEKDLLSSTSQDSSSRRNSILALMRDGSKKTIRDISVSVSGVSEKTVQRELVALVRSGVLKKEGERRWSKYFMPTTSEAAAS